MEFLCLCEYKWSEMDCARLIMGGSFILILRCWMKGIRYGFNQRMNLRFTTRYLIAYTISVNRFVKSSNVYSGIEISHPLNAITWIFCEVLVLIVMCFFYEVVLLLHLFWPMCGNSSSILMIFKNKCLLDTYCTFALTQECLNTAVQKTVDNFNICTIKERRH